MHPLVIIKTVFFQALIEIALAGYVALAIFYKSYRPRITPLFCAVCALIATIAVSSAFGVNGMRSIWSVPERMTGIVLMAHLVAYFVMLSGMRSAFSWIRYLQISVAVSFVTAIFPVIQLIVPGIFFDKMSNRLSGTIGNPIFLAAYLFCNMFFAAWLASRARVARTRSWPYSIVALFDLTVILLTQTRSVLIALFISCAVLSLYAARGGVARVRYAVFVAWALVVILGGIFWATRSNALWQNVPILSRVAVEGIMTDNRLFAWRAGMRAFFEKPILGWGWENFYAAFNAHYDPRLLRSGFNETFFDRPHNVFVQFFVETGIIGFSIYMALLICAFYYARKNAWMVALLTAYVVQNFFAFDSISSYVMFFAALAFIDAEKNAPPKTYGLGISPYRAYHATLTIFLFIVAGIALYFFNYRLYTASRLEWTSVNYFVNARMPEGLEYMDKALASPTPYHAYIAKDLYPNIALLYKQNLPLPNVRDLVANAVNGMKKTAEMEPLNYGFWIGFADMMPAAAPLDANYLDRGLTALSHAHALSPNRQATRYVRAKLLNLKGDKAGAVKAMAEAVALDPMVGDAHFYYGLLLLEDGDKDGGIRELARARELHREPRNVNEASVAAGHLGDLGAYKESALYFQKALLFEPDNAEMTMKLGLVYYFLGDTVAARRLIGGEVIQRQDLKKSAQYESLLPILRDLGLEK